MPPPAIPLWRFVLAAAIVVVLIGSIVFARRSGPPNLRISARVSGTPTPTAERGATTGTAVTHTAFLGSGAWTMSSLPACFVERERLRGPLAQLKPNFPAASERYRPASVVRAGDCTIVVGRHDLLIARGTDRLRVPPEAELYREAGGLTLVFVNGGRAEIRRY